MAERIRLERRLYDWRQLRCRALIKRAEGLRAQGSKIAQKEALLCMRDAVNDLKICRNAADNQNRNDSDLHYLERIRFAAFMTQVEIDLDLGDLKNARIHLKRAWDTLQIYERLASIVKQGQDIKPMYARFNEIENRLRKEEAKNAGRNNGVVTPQA